MEAVIACAGASSSWRMCFCLKDNFRLSRFRGEGGLQNFAAVKQPKKAKGHKWQNRCVNRAPYASSGHSFRCICPSASSYFLASPEEGEICESSDAADVIVKFVLQRNCNFGQQFKVLGEDPLLGAWDPSAAVPLQWSDNHVWSTELKIPVGKSYEYKFLLTGQNGEIEWQPGPNRSFKVSSDACSPFVVRELWDLGPALVREPYVAGDITKVEVQRTEHEIKEQEKSCKEFETENAVTVQQGFKRQSDASLDEIHEEVSPAKSDVICDVAEASTLSSAASFTHHVIQGSSSESKQGLPLEREEASFVSRGPSRQFEVKAENDLEDKTIYDDGHGLNLEEASAAHIVEEVNGAESSTIMNVLEAATKTVAFTGSVVDAVAEEPPFGIDESLVPTKNFSRKSEGLHEGDLRNKEIVGDECGVTMEEIGIAEAGLLAMASASSAASVVDPMISDFPPSTGASREYSGNVMDEVEAEETDVDDEMKREIETSVNHIIQEVSDAKSGVIYSVAATGGAAVLSGSSVGDLVERPYSKMDEASLVNERLSEDLEANTKNSKENGHFTPLENTVFSASELPLVNVALVAVLAEVSAKLLKEQK